MPGSILSFDGGLQPPLLDPAEPLVRRISCGRGFLSRRCHVLDASAARAADVVTAAADLLAVHSLFRGHCHWAAQWAQRRKRPYWAVPHGCLDPVGLSRRAQLKRLWLWRYGYRFLADSDTIIFSTRREMAKAAASLPQLKHDQHAQPGRPRGIVIPWAVDVPELYRVDAARCALRASLGISDDARILLWVGRFHASKRPLQAISAFATANPSHCHMVVIGVDETLTSVRLKAAIPATLHGRIHVLGEKRGDALAEAWLAADGYISLSAKENFGYTAADALAHGLPVILSPGHDLAYELPHDRQGRFTYGWLLPDDDLSSAVQAITEWGRAFREETEVARARARTWASARSWVADRLSYDRFANSLRMLAQESLSRAI
jgi:glycosyltransferase involved in cell wall biosynthesis